MFCVLDQHGATISTSCLGSAVCVFGLMPLMPLTFRVLFAACLSQDFESSFRVLWDMMLGSMMESGAIGSAAWTNDPQLLIFQITYCVLMFLIMLNFIIAIIGQCVGGGMDASNRTVQREALYGTYPVCPPPLGARCMPCLPVETIQCIHWSLITQLFPGLGFTSISGGHDV